jgi:hypothetical protein
MFLLDLSESRSASRATLATKSKWIYDYADLDDVCVDITIPGGTLYQGHLFRLSLHREQDLIRSITLTFDAADIENVYQNAMSVARRFRLSVDKLNLWRERALKGTIENTEVLRDETVPGVELELRHALVPSPDASAYMTLELIWPDEITTPATHGKTE